MKQASALIATLAAGASASSASAGPSFDWQSIAASKDLEYHDCYDGFKCARLIVPRDWKNKTDPNTVTLAITKLPAAVPDDDASFAGTIFSNPGGPGGSGVSFLLKGGKPLQQTVDKPGKKHYEILSWDPRGVGNTEPVIDCFEGNTLARDAEGYTAFSLPSIDSGPSALNFLLAKYRAEGGHCSKVMKEVLPYVNTPNVARDMVEMVDKIHELREREAGKKKPEDQDDEEEDGDDDRLELRRVKADKTPRLQYMGFSYGSVLGNYFAALFPERVGRVMLDGVVNTDDYSTGPGWLTAGHDTDAMYSIYFKGCFEAGSATCKLYRDGDRHPRDIQKRVTDWTANLDEEPLTTVSSDGTSIVLTAEAFRGLFFSKLYNIQTTAIPIADTIDAAMRGNATALINELTGPLTPLLNDCSVNGTDPGAGGNDAYLAISCTDGDSHVDAPVSFWRKYAKAQQKQSKIAGSGMAGARMACAGTTLRPSWEFKGPFTSPKASEDPKHPEKGRPAAPLLFVSNRWDPVTPLTSARHMYKQHPGAGLIVQESMGHCVTAKPGVSECTKKIVADFFDTGAVPDGEHVCEGLGTPWDAVSKMSVEEQEYGSFLVERRRDAHMYGI